MTRSLTGRLFGADNSKVQRAGNDKKICRVQLKAKSALLFNRTLFIKTFF